MDTRALTQSLSLAREYLEDGYFARDIQNVTAPVCKSQWELVVDNKCISFMNLIPGWTEKWNVLAVVNGLMHIIFAYNAANLMARMIQEYLNNRKIRFPLLNFMFLSCFFKFCAGVLMGVSYIDGWGFLGRLSVSSYLGMYAPAYGLIPFSVILLQAHYLDIYVRSRIGDMNPAKKTYCIMSIIYVTLGGLFSGPGYIIFGFVLRSAFLKDPNTKLGPAGNNLVTTSYSIMALGCIFIGIPVIYEIYKFNLGVRQSVTNRSCNRLVIWNIVIFILSCINIGQLNYWTVASNKISIANPTNLYEALLPIIATIELLYNNRIIEWLIIWTNIQIISAEGLDIIPCENIYRLIKNKPLAKVTSSDRTATKMSSRARSGTTDYSRRSHSKGASKGESDV